MTEEIRKLKRDYDAALAEVARTHKAYEEAHDLAMRAGDIWLRAVEAEKRAGLAAVKEVTR